MATKIKSYTFYVAITPYKVEGVENEYNELSVLADYNQYTHVFYVSLHAGWRSSFGHGCMIMGDRNPLTASTLVCIKESPKNSQKFINEMGGALELAKNDIAWLFNERNWDELKRLVKDVAICGYTPGIEQRMKDLRNPQNPNNNNSSSNKTEETMEKKMKAADLIGKTIVNGNMKYIVIEAIDDEKIKVEFTSGDRAPVAMPMRVEQVDKLLAGGWKIDADKSASEKGTVNSEKFATAAEDVEEVEDIKPEKPKAKTVKMDEPKAETEKPKGKQEKPKAEKPKADSKLVYSTYQNKKGKTCAKITGFKDDDAVYQSASELHGSASYERGKDGSKTFYLVFGPRYVTAAKDMCAALNAGKTLSDCKSIVDKATEERAQQREEQKQKREEHKAEKSEGKVYTEQEVVDLVERIIAGDKAAMDELNAMRKAA